MDFILKYGWIFLLIAVMGELFVPYILAPFYKGYRHTTMAISTLGNKSSPVRLPFNLWMLAAGVLLLLSTPGIFERYCNTSVTLSMLTVLCIGGFAIGACIFTCFFSVNESKNTVTTASKIHGVGSAIGFMLLLLVPLLLAILSFQSADMITGIVSIVSFGLALTCFVLFIVADKPQVQTKMIAKEGLWQRLNLFFMYLPLAFIAITILGS